MSNESMPEAGELLPSLNRIADALERLANSAMAANCIAEDSSRFLCETVANGLYQLRDKPASKGRGGKW